MSRSDVTQDVPASLRILIDTNVFISAEPYGQLPTDVSDATGFIRLAHEQGHKVFVHPAIEDDLRENSDADRLGHRLAVFNRYPRLDESPISTNLAGLAGESEVGSNDHRDLRLLAALESHAVTHLVTNDNRLRRRARRAGLVDSTYTVGEATDLLRQLAPAASPPPPLVSRVAAYTLNTDQPFFDSLKDDYGTDAFSKWMDKVRSESDHRPCFIVEQDATYAGLALLKHEPACEYPLAQPVVKLTTFKVDPSRSGRKYGELLMKCVFSFAHGQRAASLYVTAFPHHESLCAMLEEFGFQQRLDSRNRPDQRDRFRQDAAGQPRPQLEPT